MVLGSRPRLIECRQLNLQADNTNIQTVNAQKLVGLYVDKQLSWSDHIDHLCSVLSSKISLLKQLAEYIPTDAQKRFFFVIYSSFNRLWIYNLGVHIKGKCRKIDQIAETRSKNNTENRYNNTIFSYVSRVKMVINRR